MSQGINEIITYGTKNALTIGNIVSNDPFLTVTIENNISLNLINTQLVGDYNLPNVLCAVAIGKYFNVPDDKIKNAIQSYHPSNGRSQLILKGSNTIILDAYNANPTSMKAAIENFSVLNANHKILFLGGMMELGEDSIHEHQLLVDFIKLFNWEKVILVGGDFSVVNHPFLFFNNSIAAKAWFSNQEYINRHILIKGSRSTKMELILD